MKKFTQYSDEEIMVAKTLCELSVRDQESVVIVFISQPYAGGFFSSAPSQPSVAIKTQSVVYLPLPMSNRQI